MQELQTFVGAIPDWNEDSPLDPAEHAELPASAMDPAALKRQPSLGSTRLGAAREAVDQLEVDKAAILAEEEDLRHKRMVQYSITLMCA